VRAIGDAIAPTVAELNEASGGAVLAHGQGALWGGLFTNADPAARTAANVIFKKKCAEARVLPYFVPVGGFMLTPRYDDADALGAAVKDMAQAALEVSREMGWAPSALLPMSKPEVVKTPEEVWFDAKKAKLAEAEAEAAKLRAEIDAKAPVAA